MKYFKRQLAFLSVYSFASCLHLTDAVWVALLAARGFSLWQIGLAEGVFHVVSLAGEVPSGMAADLLGRRRTLAAGAALAAVSDLAMAAAPGVGAVCAAMGCKALAYNMLSGTEEALTFDSLKAAGRADDYLRVSARLSVLQRLAGALGSLASLLTDALRYAGFYLASAAANALALWAAAHLREPVVTEAQAARPRTHLRELPARFAAHARASADVLRAAPAAARLIAADAAVCLPTYLTQMFLQQRLVEQGWPAAWLFAPALLGGAAGMAGTALAQRLRPRRLGRLFALCALGSGLGAVLVGAAPVPGGMAGAALVQAAVSVWTLHALRRLQELIPSDRRATLLSVDSMAYSLLMIPASPLAGLLADLTGRTGAGLCALGAAVALCAAAPAAFARRRGRA